MNYIHKLLPHRQLRVPLLGSLLIIGGIFAYRAKPVLSTQMEYLRTLTAGVSDSQTYTWVQRNPAVYLGTIHKEAQLHKVLKKARLYKALSAKSAQKHTRIHKAIRKAARLQKSFLLPDNQEQTYTWLQRNPPAPVVAKAQEPKKEAEIAPRGNFSARNGVYLYGQSPKPNQLGQGYIIFEKLQAKVVGALYIPGSEYSCFNGTLDPSGELAMTVKGYPGESSPTQVATNNTIPRLNDDEPITYAHSVTLQDYHRINSVSSQDHQILQACKANLRE